MLIAVAAGIACGPILVAAAIVFKPRLIFIGCPADVEGLK
jgi:hypothetical protein